MKVYGRIMQFALRIGLREPIQRGRYTDLLKADQLGDVVIGDLIEINSGQYLYRGMNKNGGPGQAHYAMMGYPTPQFSSPIPQREEVITVFALDSFPYWKKVGHRTPEEWENLAAQLD